MLSSLFRFSLALSALTLLAGAPLSAVQVFNQPFTSSNTVSNYANSAAPDPTTQFNDIGADPNGGTWSINASHQLQLVRTGGSSNNGAGISRYTSLLGPPKFLKVSFTFGLSGITATRSQGMVLDVGALPATTASYTDGIPYNAMFNRLSVDVSSGPSQFRFKIGDGGATTAYYPADGTMYAVTYYLNASGSTQTYTAPDGTTQPLNNNCISLWLNNTQVFTNATHSDANLSLGTFRMRWGLPDTGTWKIGNVAIDNNLPNNGITGKIVLGPGNIISEEARGVAGLMLDEQTLTNDPANGLGGTPLNTWVLGPGNNSWYYPAHAIIDLGGTYNLTHIDVFNGSTTGTFAMYAGSPFNWSGSALFTDSLGSTGQWVDHPVSVQTRYLRIQLASQNSVPPEIVLYGSIVGSPVVPPTPVTVTPPNIENFMGVNAEFYDPINRVSTLGVVREYHNWSWDEGDGVAGYPGYPNNQNAFNPNGWGWNFDELYTNMHNLGITLFPCVQGNVTWLNGSYNGPPINPGGDPLLPASYAAHADHLYQMAARYGAVAVATNKLKVSPTNAALSGLDVVRYYENANEQDGWWNGADAWCGPYVFAAQSSADRDGHLGAMGATFGVKNADPSAKLVMGGLANAVVDYVKAMKLWADQYRGGDFPADVINLHVYATDGGDQKATTTGISPETFQLRQKVQVFREYRDQYLPGKEVWVTEFGYDTNPGSPFAAPAIGSFSNDEVQGQWNVRSFLALAAAGIDRATIFVMSDSDENDTTQFATSGLIRSPAAGWTPKPSWFYISTMKARLTGLHYYGEQSSGNSNVMIYQFADVTNTVRAYAVWCPTASQLTVNNYTLALQGSPAVANLVTLTNGNVNGVVTPLAISGNAVNVTVGEKPLFVLTGALAPEVVPDQKIALSPSMVTNEDNLGSASALVDEQTLAGDPDNNNGGSPVTAWTAGYTEATYPHSAYIDLGQMTALSKIYLYDGSSNANYTVSIGSPGHWTPVISATLVQYNAWEGYVLPPGTLTRYVRFSPSTSYANMNEVVLYKKGELSSSGAPLTAAAFRTVAGLAADGSQDALTPGKDGVPNLLKFAFNMTASNYADLASFNHQRMTAAGTSGLPLTQADGSGHLSISFLQRIGSPGIAYLPQVGNDLSGSWTTLATPSAITPIDGTWQRVTYTDTETPATTSKRFIRVKVTSP